MNGRGEDFWHGRLAYNTNTGAVSDANAEADVYSLPARCAGSGTMNERVMQFRVGVLVLAAVVMAVILVALFAGISAPLGGGNTFYVRLSSAPGLTAGAPVCKRGVRIGAVSKVELTADDSVLATLRIDARHPIYVDETCWLKGNLFGDAQLDFEPVGPAGSGI